jgi:5-methylcytosine-specific restriction endonuclease McrA
MAAEVRDYTSVERFKLNIWRRSILQRDKYACKKCKSGVLKELQIHHILPWAKYPDLRLEVSNGITFCKTCHKNFHHRFGNNCNVEQLELFLNTDTST